MSDPHKIKVLIVDDHDMLCMGLKISLSTYDDIVIVGEAANGQQAITLCKELQPDVVLMDITMTVMDGLKATAVIRQQRPEIAVVILTSSPSKEREQEAYHAGARSVLQKGIRSDQMRESILLAIR